MNHFISLATAVEMTAFYRTNRNMILKPEFQDLNILPICESFDREAFEQILSEAECRGVRIYYGMKDDKKVHAIIVGFKENGEDILPEAEGGSTNVAEDEDKIIENGGRCPDICPPTSPLNP